MLILFKAIRIFEQNYAYPNKFNLIHEENLCYTRYSYVTEQCSQGTHFLHPKQEKRNFENKRAKIKYLKLGGKIGKFHDP